MCLKSLKISYTDISNSLKQFHLAALLGWQDVRQRYRRSVLGPFWLTVSMGVMIGTIGIEIGPEKISTQSTRNTSLNFRIRSSQVILHSFMLLRSGPLTGNI